MNRKSCSLFVLSLLALSASLVSGSSGAQANSTAEMVLAQTCDQGLSITYRLGTFLIKKADGGFEKIVSDNDKEAHSASFYIVWDANPNALGGAVLFPKDASEPAANCNLVK